MSTISIKAALASAVALTGVALAAGHSAPVQAEDKVVENNDTAGSGALLLRAQGMTSAMPAVRLGTDMDVTISGTVARVRVVQAFRNTSNRWMEASYLYPLPENGAVDSLKMVVGQRVIIGRIKQRAAARELYEEAKAKGHKAGLVEQQRPNMFSSSVANVGPGETVLVAIEYQAPVRQVAGRYSLRLPLVVGPRYVPPHTLTSPDKLADAARIVAPPIMIPRAGQTLNPVSITVHLAPGFVPADLSSPYHQIAIDGAGQTRTIRLAKGVVPADRDFELGWRSASAEPTVGLYRQHLGTEDYVMASIAPPVVSGVPVAPRKMIFVIDNSGSMGGSSMDEAKASLVHALGTLRPQDHFNVIRFDDTMTKLFDQSVAATPEQVATAIRFARGLEASGGTEMLPALKAALADAAATGGSSMLRQIIFLTDGDISNEAEMEAAIVADGGRSHLFPVGIGSAPNQHLMARMAALGRGTYTNIGSPEEVATKTSALIDMLQRPAVRDLKVSIAGGSLDLTPRILPDLYPGQPVTLVGKTGQLTGTMTISGQINQRNWSTTVRLGDAIESPSVAKYWARRRVDDVETDLVLGRIEQDAANAAITGLGLNYGLVTSQTSLVAIDETPSRPAGTPLTREELPINLPAGWDFDSLLGGETARAAMANAATASKPSAGKQSEQIDLPRTAANFLPPLASGLMMLLLGAIGLLMIRRRRGIA